MNAPTPVPLVAAPPGEQLRYAAWLERTARGGLAALVLAYAAYVLGFVAPLVPLDTLPTLWNRSAADYLLQTGTPTGWGWLAMATRSDLANLLGIAVLAGSSIPCLLAVLPLYARRGERAYVLVCALQIAVLLLAASGLVMDGH